MSSSVPNRNRDFVWCWSTAPIKSESRAWTLWLILKSAKRKTHAVSHFASELHRTISMSPVNDHMCKWMNNKLELVSAAQEKPSDVAHISLNLCTLPAIIKASGEWPGGKESNPRTRSEKWFKFALKINNMVMWIHVVILPTFMTELCRKVMWIIKVAKKKRCA